MGGWGREGEGDEAIMLCLNFEHKLSLDWRLNYLAMSVMLCCGMNLKPFFACACVRVSDKHCGKVMKMLQCFRLPKVFHWQWIEEQSGKNYASMLLIVAETLYSTSLQNYVRLKEAGESSLSRASSL